MTLDTDDDDRLREALRRNAPPPQAATVLRQLQPAMRRSRSHRSIAKGTATALLVISGGAAVLAVNATLPGPERRALTTLPSVTDPASDQSASTAAVTTDRLLPAPASPDSPDDPTSSNESQTTSPEGGIPGTETTRTSPSVTPPPAPAASVNPPAAPAAPTAAPTTLPDPIDVVTVAPPTTTPPSPSPPASSSTSTVSSECGTVVIGVDGQRIHVDSIAPSPGFTSQVSTDGPETVELVLVSSSEKCEIHVESNVDGLHVEVQDGS